MNTKLHPVASLAMAFALSLGTSQAFAAAPAARPATSKPSPAPDQAKRRGAGDRIMSRDELRACMQLKDRNEAGAADIAQRQERMKNERDALADAPDSAAAARARLEPQLKAVEQADALVREHGKAVQDWNERMADFESKSKDMRNADRRRIVLKQERAALEAAEQPLVADRNEKVAAYERAVKDVNDKIGQHAARSSDWNKRNEELAAAEDRLNDARHKWTAECGDRRFREEDEIAIKAGK